MMLCYALYIIIKLIILLFHVAGGDSYVNPWSKECAKNTTKKLKQFGSQLEGLHQGEGEREKRGGRVREGERRENK